MQELKISNNYDERSAGGIVFRRENGKVAWLLIRTFGVKKFGRVGGGGKNGRYVYKFPKGHLSGKEFLKQAAAREVEEEGRIKAKIIDKIGSRNYIISDKLSGKKIVKKVTFFLMEYLEESRLRHFDREAVLERVWLPFEEAIEKLAYDPERVLLKKAKDKLGKIV